MPNKVQWRTIIEICDSDEMINRVLHGKCGRSAVMRKRVVRHLVGLKWSKRAIADMLGLHVRTVKKLAAGHTAGSTTARFDTLTKSITSSDQGPVVQSYKPFTLTKNNNKKKWS